MGTAELYRGCHTALLHEPAQQTEGKAGQLKAGCHDEPAHKGHGCEQHRPKVPGASVERGYRDLTARHHPCAISGNLKLQQSRLNLVQQLARWRDGATASRIAPTLTTPCAVLSRTF